MVRFLLLLLLAAPLAAQQGRPPGCTAPTYRAFDYWVGEWSVSDSTGRPIAESSVTRLADGCAVLEQWRPTGGVQGTSLNWFDPADGRWHQSWVAGGAPAVHFVGGAEDGTMRLSATAVDRQGLRARMRWEQREGGIVRQVLEHSRDGATWSVSFVGEYRRKP